MAVKNPDKERRDRIKLSIDAHKCASILEKLQAEKRKLLKLAASPEPPQNIVELLETNGANYKALYEKTIELQARMDKLGIAVA